MYMGCRKLGWRGARWSYLLQQADKAPEGVLLKHVHDQRACDEAHALAVAQLRVVPRVRPENALHHILEGAIGFHEVAVMRERAMAIFLDDVEVGLQGMVVRVHHG
jgi:hypothetical protein